MYRALMDSVNTILLFIIAMALGAILMLLVSNQNNQTVPANNPIGAQVETLAPTETIPPFTPFSSATPTRTLLPPPTFEPPTATVPPSATPTTTPSQTPDTSISVQGLVGAETPTPEGTPVDCEPREDWVLTYTVQFNDALATIAERYSTTSDALATGNCLANPDLIVEGQVLRVPGDAPPALAQYDCGIPFEAITPFDGALTIEGDGTLTFNWRGPDTPRYYLRVFQPDGNVYQKLIELRTNETVDLFNDLPLGGMHTWTVTPVGFDLEEPCPTGGPWRFTKEEAPDATVVPNLGGFNLSDLGNIINTGPTALFAVSSTTPNAGDSVTFFNLSTGNITSYAWDFDGDGTIDNTSQNPPPYVYAAAGTYTARLTVTGPDGTNTFALLITVT